MEQNSIESNEAVAETAAEAQTTAEAAPRRRSRRASAAVGEAVEAPAAPAADAAPAAAAAETAPKKRATRSRKKADPAPEASSEKSTEAPAAAEPAAAEPAPAADADASASAAPAEAPKASRGRSRRAASTAAEKSESAAGTDAKADTKNEAENEAKNEAKAEEQPESKNEAKTGDATGEEGAPAEAAPKKRNSRNRSKKPAAEAANDGEAKASTENEGDEKESGRNGSENRNGADKQGRGGDAQQRSSRTRQRERKRRGQGDDLEPEITEDDVLLPIAGILDVLDNYAFVRTSGYLPGTNDVYVSLGQVKKYGLRKGDSVVGAIRQPREGEGGGRQKYNAIVRVDTINSRPAEENQERVDFASFTPLHPSERLRLETEGGGATQRVIDLFAPIGKGQRGLVVGPRESGKSTALRRIAAAVSANQPDAHLMLVLIDERPEEVTELQRTINGEVIASTFDRTPEDHVTIAELAIERAKRLVELGHDVVVLLDSVTGLARAYNAHAPAGVRVPAGQLDATAIHPVKRLLSAARNIENGGSLTIIATASAQPGSTVDEALLGELEAVANSQLRLSGEAADRRVFPAVDLRASATRREELLTGESEAGVMNSLRRALAGSDREQALESVLKQIEGTSSNVEFLALTQRSQG